MGPAPGVAAAALAYGALCLLFATLRHPALAPVGEARDPGPSPAERRPAVRLPGT